LLVSQKIAWSLVSQKIAWFLVSQKIARSLISQKIACSLSSYLAMQNLDLDSAMDAHHAGNLMKLVTSMVASMVAYQVVARLASVHLSAAVVCIPTPRHPLFSVPRLPLYPAKPMRSVGPLMSVVRAAWAVLYRDHSLTDACSHCLEETMMKNALR
jgi:hypothetical protein